MKPAKFEYERPTDIAAALALIARDDVAARFIAGGQSLGPMLNLRLAQPDLLIDLTALPDLKRVEETADAVILGACVTHADIEDGRVPDGTRGVLPSVARNIAYRAVRNRGTVGGSLAHADPSADWMSCLAALGATVILRGPQGQRRMPVEDLMVGVFTTVLEPGEMIEAVSIPKLSRDTRWGYYKVCRKTGEFAHAIGAVLHDPARGVSRAVIGATGGAPIILSGEGFAPSSATSLASGMNEDAVSEALTRAGVTDPIDRQVHVVALRRAAQQADAR